MVVGAADGRVAGSGVGAGVGFCVEQPARPTNARTVALREAR